MFFNDAFKMKSFLVFMMIGSIIRNQNLKKLIPQLFVEDKIINLTKTLFQQINNAFGVKTIKNIYKQFIQHTGLPRIDVSYIHSIKENTMELTLLQTPC